LVPKYDAIAYQSCLSATSSPLFSKFSSIETVMTAFMDLFKKALNTKWKKIGVRLVICIMFFVLSLPMTTKSGSYIWGLIDTFGSENALIFVGLFESIAIPWIYGESLNGFLKGDQ
jgi:SNF family Na+-dependent transporter